MKKCKITMVLNRQINNSICVNFAINDNNNEGEFYILFRSIEAYKSFKKNPKIKEDWLDSYDLAIYKQYHFDLFTETNEFKEMVKNCVIKYEVSENKKINEAVFRHNLPLVVDISNISFQKKMDIITNPLVSDNVRFLDKYTEDEEVSLKEISEMYQYILNIAQKIKSKNYTQLESIYYIYSELKKKKYNEEGKDESYHKSRSLNQIINSNKIVCAGYSNYFLAISDILHLNVEEILWDPIEGHKSGHSSLIAFINDPKYKAQGVWGIDTTWDSKRSEDDEEYKLNLSHFLMPLAYDELDKEKHFLGNPHNNHYYIIEEAMKRYYKLLSYNAPKIIIKNAIENIIKKINVVYQLLGIETINSECDIEEEYKKIICYKKKYLSILEMDKLVNYVTPKNPDDAIKAMKTTCSYKCMNDNSRSIYRLIRILK